MRFDKGATAQDDSITKGANFAAQPLLEREFSLFLLEDLLGLLRSKGRRGVLGGNRAPQKQMLAMADKEDVELLGNQIKSNKTNFLIGAAEEISKRLQAHSPGTYRGWLNDSVGKLLPKHREILDALTGLPGVLATLNYDGLIEQASNRKAVTWLREDKVQEVLRRKLTDAVLHIHGWFDEPDSVVLGLSSYAKVAGHAHTKAVLQLFTVDRTLLFVGCGGTVKDPNFSQLVEWAREAIRNVPPRHVLLCREEELEVVRASCFRRIQVVAQRIPAYTCRPET